MEFYEESKKDKNNNGEEFTFLLQSDDVLIKDSKQNLVGEFSFKELDYDKGFKITHAYTDRYNSNYKRTGLGEKAILFFKSCKGGANIYVSFNYESQDDGSHLTGQGEFFVSRMIEKGILLNLDSTNVPGGFIEPTDLF